MTRSTLSRTAVGAALSIVLTSFAFAVPASADTTEDPTPPGIEWVSDIEDGDAFVVGQVPSEPTCVATSDDPSVDLTCEVTGYSTASGEHTLVATAVATLAVVDPVVGEELPHSTTTESRSYTVDDVWKATGFAKPVKMTSVTKVKGGSVVPLVFKVYRNGVKQSAKSSVTAFVAQKVDCSDSTVVLGTSSILSTKKGYTLKYTSGAFHQNWKAPKRDRQVVNGKTVSVPTCYLVTMTGQGDAVLTASFSIK
ncbi:MAG: PxKF domain-containing protein [Actinobacteria bacterium]|nr:PxKF domain-containing protein [Actinomycetota bacterium]